MLQAHTHSWNATHCSERHEWDQISIFLPSRGKFRFPRPWISHRRMLWFPPWTSKFMNPVTSRTQSLASPSPSGPAWTHPHYLDLFFRLVLLCGIETPTQATNMALLPTQPSSSPPAQMLNHQVLLSLPSKYFSNLSHSPHFEYCSTLCLEFHLPKYLLHTAAKGVFLKCKANRVTHYQNLFEQFAQSFSHASSRHGACTGYGKYKADSETDVIPALIGKDRQWPNSPTNCIKVKYGFMISAMKNIWS